MVRSASISLHTAIDRRVSRLFWGGLFVLLASLLNCRPAEATCGDYLLHSNSGGMSMGDYTYRGTIPVEAPAPVQPTPCQGPGCRQAPVPPPATPSAPVEFLPQQFAASLSRFADLTDPLQSWLTLTARIRATDGYPRGLLRPPAV